MKTIINEPVTVSDIKSLHRLPDIVGKVGRYGSHALHKLHSSSRGSKKTVWVNVDDLIHGIRPFSADEDEFNEFGVLFPLKTQGYIKCKINPLQSRANEYALRWEFTLDYERLLKAFVTEKDRIDLKNLMGRDFKPVVWARVEDLPNIGDINIQQLLLNYSGSCPEWEQYRECITGEDLMKIPCFALCIEEVGLYGLKILSCLYSCLEQNKEEVWLSMELLNSYLIKTDKGHNFLKGRKLLDSSYEVDGQLGLLSRIRDLGYIKFRQRCVETDGTDEYQLINEVSLNYEMLVETIVARQDLLDIAEMEAIGYEERLAALEWMAARDRDNQYPSDWDEDGYEDRCEETDCVTNSEFEKQTVETAAQEATSEQKIELFKNRIRYRTLITRIDNAIKRCKANK